MKKAIAGLIAGFVLGTASVGVAATQSLWERGGNGYKCWGVSSGAICNQTGSGVTWSTMIDKKSVVIMAGERGSVAFGCYRGKSKWSCRDFRRIN
jgi:hypothetical protein